jgi:hypothetical protein
MDLMLACVFAGVECQLRGVLVRLWRYVHVGGFPDVVELLVDPESLRQGVEVPVTPSSAKAQSCFMCSSSLGTLAAMYAAVAMIAASLVLGSMSTSLKSASRFLAMLCVLPPGGRWDHHLRCTLDE